MTLSSPNGFKITPYLNQITAVFHVIADTLKTTVLLWYGGIIDKTVPMRLKWIFNINRKYAFPYSPWTPLVPSFGLLVFCAPPFDFASRFHDNVLTWKHFSHYRPLWVDRINIRTNIVCEISLNKWYFADNIGSGTGSVHSQELVMSNSFFNSQSDDTLLMTMGHILTTLHHAAILYRQ